VLPSPSLDVGVQPNPAALEVRDGTREVGAACKAMHLNLAHTEQVGDLSDACQLLHVG